MKYLLSSILFLVIYTSIAQLSISNLDDDTPILDGDSFQYDTTIFEDAKLKFKISNSSSTQSINVLAEMVSFTNTNGTNLQFCVNPECYFDVTPGSTIPNNPIVLGPGENNGEFDYFSNSNPGDGVNYPITYTLRFFMLDSQGNEVGEDLSITYLYDPEPLSTTDFELNELGLQLKATLVQDVLQISAAEPTKLELFNIAGKRIGKYNLKSGDNYIDVNQVNTGVNLAVFTNNKGQRAVTKWVKQ